MLSKGITRDEKPITGNIRKHAVWPMEHPGFDKLNCPFSQTDAIPRFYYLIGPILCVKVGKQVLLSHFRAENLLRLYKFYNFRDKT